MFHRGAVPSNFRITFDRQWSRAFYSRPVALVGEQLRHAREAQDYSIPDVVGMTNLMTDQVLALESGDWSAFAAPVYVRGFVRSYAGVLKLDAVILLAELDEEMGQANREKTVEVNIVSAREISAEQQEKLASALSAKLERTVNMQVSIDSSLIGGAVVRAGDTVIDGSIRGRLSKLAEALHS